MKYLKFLPIAAALLFGISFARAQTTPGGVTNANLTWMAWLTPDSYSNGAWTNLIGGEVGNFTQPTTWTSKTPPAVTTGTNFHPAVQFRPNGNNSALNRMLSENGINLANTDAFTFIIVYKAVNAGFDYQNMLNFSSAQGYLNNYALGYRTNVTNALSTLSMGWTNSTQRDLGKVPFDTIALVTIDNNNNNGIRHYLNGAQIAAAGSQNGSVNNRIVLGASYYDLTGNGEYGVNADIQEVIILKRPDRTAYPFLASLSNTESELNKIQSYLAVKYGISMNTNYIATNDIVVWNNAANAPYNNNIFGIGRDDATGLYQKQSQNVNSKALTVFTGNAVTPLNSQNTGTLADGQYLMLGSNGLVGNVDYEYHAGDPFANGSLSNKINYHSATIYKAQVTGGGSQTVNIKVASTNTTAQYILVSDDPAFPTGSTDIYPISSLTAQNVVINNGYYITTAGYQPLPGGLKSVTFSLWLTPDSYSNGVWTNRIVGTGIGDFTQPANWTTKTPPAVTTGTNFHPAVQFRPNGNNIALNRLLSESGINLTTSDAFTFILVYKAANAGFDYQNILNFAGGNEQNLSSYSLGYYNNNNTTLSMGWTARNALGKVPFDTTALVTVDNNNGQVTANGIRHYLNGAQIATATSVSSSVNNKIVLGASYNDLTTNGERGVNADIQEVILLKRPKASYQDINSGNDLKKVQTYLAVKYGISMNTSDYMATDGTVVWSNSGNAGYNNNIFGIGRDDATGLYQKQSQNLNSKSLMVFVGNAVTTLNSQNTGTLADGQYLMIGSNGGSVISNLENVNDGDIYSNGTIVSSNGFNIQSPVYKAQVSGPLPAMTVKMMAPSNDFIYALVSADENFTSGNPGNTKIYPVNNRIVQLEIDQTYRFIKFIGFAPGPGGVNPGLKLWLRADDDAAITIQNLDWKDTKLTGYPDPISDTANVQGVAVWKDLVRGHTYSYAAGEVSNNHLMPVYKRYSPEMNYHPAVRFWGTNNDGAYLSNPSGIFSSAKPAGGKHTAYFLVNNKFGNNNVWVYPFTFSQSTGSSKTHISTANMPFPGYGANPVSTGIVARFRANGTECDGTNGNLFTPGATSLLGFKTNTDVTNNRIYFRFNAKSDSSNTRFGWNNADFTHASIIGGGYAYSRIIQGVMSEAILYDRELDANETQLLESYLALKYGVTLYPSNATGRFSYKFSDNTVIWDGDTPAGNIFADFYHNVAAVIRDNTARLDNRQSHSTNVGSLLHLGVAGTMLSDDGSSLGNLNNMEAVVFGSDGATGATSVNAGEPCSPFTDRFNRKWLVHKVANRSITLLVGAQNYNGKQLGNDASTFEYYNKLNAGNDICLIVADSPAAIEAGNYRAVIPMTYINGEHQCSYTFTDEDTYITFGWKPNTGGCAGDADAVFSGSKTFNWTQNKAAANNSANPGLTIPVNTTVDLGDGIKVTATSVTYPVNVRANRGYPRSGNTPVRGSLEVQRRGGSTYQDVVVNVAFNHPVIPEFSISGLDSYRNSYEEVEVYGVCSGNNFAPVLSYASTPNRNTTYAISGNVATVTKRGSIAGNNNNGKVNVKFQGGVTGIVIKYRTKTAATTATQQIYISPITLRSVPLPPPVNDDGLSFVKQVKEHNISTCEPAEYTFYIQNVNCNPMSVDFSDILPEKMKWDTASIGLDAASSALNNSLNTQIIPAGSGNGETLQINGLVVPGTSTLILTATAVFDEDAPGGEYSNRASIVYDPIVNSNPVQQTLYSFDRETLEPNTVFTASQGVCLEKVTMDAAYSRKTYSAESEIEVTYTLTNPNADITDMYLNININPEFAYKANTLQITQENIPAIPPVPVTPDPQDASSSLIIAGSTDGVAGFTLPTGVTVIKFTLKAPALANLRDEVDENNLPTGKKVDLNIIYDFSSTMDDPCVIMAIEGLQGNKLIPYSAGRMYIISNKHVTSKIIR